MTSGTPTFCDSPSLAQRPLVFSAPILTTTAAVARKLTPSSVGCQSHQVNDESAARVSTLSSPRRTETVRFEILDDEAGVSSDRRNRNFSER
jgi:hypothetical protein